MTVLGLLPFTRYGAAEKAAIEKAKASGGTIESGGRALTERKGNFVLPTIITGLANDAEVVQTETFAPIVYVVACLVVIAINVEQVPGAITAIVDGAFSPEGVTGGVLGVMIIGMLLGALCAALWANNVCLRWPTSRRRLLQGLIGGIIAVAPSQFGVGVMSPRLDAHGNSTRASASGCQRQAGATR